MREYEKINGDNNTYKLKFINPPFNDIIFSYSRVEIGEKDDHAVLSFDYHIHEGTVDDIKEFQQELGDFLTELIELELAKRELVYTGGID